MSWHFSQALVEEYSRATCSDGELFALSSGNPTPQAYCSPDRMKDCSRLSRFGMTFAPLTDEAGAALLTWFQAGFPARTSALPEKAPESTASEAACGHTWHASLARFDRDSCSWKTVQPCLLGDSDESSVTWPRSGMTAGGRCWELPMLGRRTSGTGSGLWVPTPIANDAEKRGNFDPVRSWGLAGYAKLWPTPTSTLGTKGGQVTPQKAREGGTLIEALSARQTWPTPQASDNRNRGTTSTPAIARRIEAGKQVMLSMTMPGALNPDWVEWLMGWPIGWTSLGPMGSTDAWQQAACDGSQWAAEPEDVPRVTSSMPARAPRLKAIGNGQVPHCAAMAWQLLTESMT